MKSILTSALTAADASTLMSLCIKLGGRKVPPTYTQVDFVVDLDLAANGHHRQAANLDHGLVSKRLLVCLLEVEAAVVQGLVVVLLEDLGEQRLHVLLDLPPFAILLLQTRQHHWDGCAGVLLQQIHNLRALLTCQNPKQVSCKRSSSLTLSGATSVCTFALPTSRSACKQGLHNLQR